MGAYAVTADVEALVGRTISTTSVPTAAQTLQSTVDLEADLDAELDAIGLTVPITGTNPVLICKRVIAHAAAAQFLRNKDTVSNSTESKEQIEGFQAVYDKFITDIRENPALVADKLNQSYGTSADKGLFRSHVRDNSQDLEVDDFDPVFRKDDQR